MSHRSPRPRRCSERTAVLPTPQPVPQPIPQLAPQPVPFGQNGWNPAGVNNTAVDPAIRPAMQHVINQAAQSVPTEALMQGPPAPNPADVRRGMYLHNGVLPLFLLAVPVAVLAASFPAHRPHCGRNTALAAIDAGVYNTEPQLSWNVKAGAAASARTLIR